MSFCFFVRCRGSSSKLLYINDIPRSSPSLSSSFHVVSLLFLSFWKYNTRCFCWYRYVLQVTYYSFLTLSLSLLFSFSPHPIFVFSLFSSPSLSFPSPSFLSPL